MPPLDRALALTEREDLAARVGENLDLDVPGGPDDLLDVEGRIAERGLRRPDGHGSVGKPDVEGVAVGGRVDRDRLDLELVQPPDHAHRDLAAVRHQHTLEHQRPSGRPLIGSSSKSNWPYSTGSALPTWMARSTASWSALTSFISFIASRMQRVWPGATASPSSTNGGAPGCGAR